MKICDMYSKYMNYILKILIRNNAIKVCDMYEKYINYILKICNNVLKICNLCIKCVQCMTERQYIVSVSYHCGGWSEEVNSCILILSYMVYL